MSVGGIKSYKFYLVQTTKASDGSLLAHKIDSVAVTDEIGAQLPGSNIEFEFVQVDTVETSLTSVLIGLSK